MERQATEKQLAYAKKIAEVTGKTDILSNFSETMDDISSFISMFEEEYKSKVSLTGQDDEPTIKQVKFAKVIFSAIFKRNSSTTLSNEYKSLKTKSDYSKFISKYRPQWEEITK